MTTVHDTYSYQRFIKTEEYPPPAQSEPLTSDEQPPPSNPGAINRLTSQQRNQLLLKATRAERALRLQQTTERHHPEIKQSALVWNNLGIRQLESGDMPRAFRNFQEAIAQDPSLSIAYNNTGVLYLEIGDLEQARHYLDIAIALQPYIDVPYSNRGLAWTEAGHYELAQWDFENAVRLSPNDPLHHNNLGILYLELGELENALAHLEKAIELDPRNPMHYGNRGMIHEAAANIARANEDYLHAGQLAEALFQEELSRTQT